MRQLARIALCAALAILALASVARAAGEPGRFDYYVLVLSWSPTYCQTDARNRNERQCNGSRPYAFVLHGLWPQYDRGWPENCRTKDRPWVPEGLIRAMLDIMPARGLIIHQYRDHGTCSGLPPREYFAAARRAFESVKIPARYVKPSQPIHVSPQQMESDFVATNPELARDMMSVVCGHGQRLRELRICFNKDLTPRRCGVNESQRRLCSARTITLPPVRGR